MTSCSFVPTDWHSPCVVVPTRMHTSHPLTNVDEPKWHPWPLIARDVQKCCRCKASYFCPITSSALGSSPAQETPSCALHVFASFAPIPALLTREILPSTKLYIQRCLSSRISSQSVGSPLTPPPPSSIHSHPLSHPHPLSSPPRRNRGLGPQPHRLTVTPDVTGSTTDFSCELLTRFLTWRDSINTLSFLAIDLFPEQSGGRSRHPRHSPR